MNKRRLNNYLPYCNTYKMIVKVERDSEDESKQMKKKTRGKIEKKELSSRNPAI